MNKIVVSIFAIAMAMGSIQSVKADSIDSSGQLVKSESKKLGESGQPNNRNKGNNIKSSASAGKELSTIAFNSPQVLNYFSAINTLQNQVQYLSQILKEMPHDDLQNKEQITSRIRALKISYESLIVHFRELKSVLNDIQSKTVMNTANNSGQRADGNGSNEYKQLYNNKDANVKDLPPDVLKELLNKYGQGKRQDDKSNIDVTHPKQIKQGESFNSISSKVEYIPLQSIDEDDGAPHFKIKRTTFKKSNKGSIKHGSSSIKKLLIRLQNKGLTSLSFLPSELPEADGLFLDNNNLTDLSSLPYMPELSTLQVVNNPLTKSALMSAKWSNMPKLGQVYLPDSIEEKDREDVENVIHKAISNKTIHIRWGFRR